MKNFLNALALVLLFAGQAFAAAVIPSDPGATGSDIRIWGKSVSDYLQLTTVGVVTLTQPATAATITIIDNKTLTINKTLTLDGTDGTTMTFPSTSATLARTDAANTFTGVQSMTSPVLTTPVLGVAAATSINKVAITAPATSATLTILNGKTLTVNNTLTLSGTDSSTLNIGTGGTLGTAAYTATPTSASTIALWTGTCNSSSVLGGDGVCAAVSSVATSLSGTAATVVASTPVINLTQTWNNAAVTFTAVKVNVTATAKASTSNLLDLQTGGASMFSVSHDGILNLNSTIAMVNTSSITWAAHGGVNSPANGNFQIFADGFAAAAGLKVSTSGVIEARTANDAGVGSWRGGHQSSDGTAGATTTCTIVGLTSITVKNGLITGCS